VSPNYDSGPMAPARPATVADVLDAAADHVEQYGLERGWYSVDPMPAPCCTVGAVFYVTTGAPEPVKLALADDALDALARYLDGQRLIRGASPEAVVIDWSDKTDADEVIATLRHVAQQHRQAAQSGGA